MFQMSDEVPESAIMQDNLRLNMLLTNLYVT